MRLLHAAVSVLLLLAFPFSGWSATSSAATPYQLTATELGAIARHAGSALHRKIVTVADKPAPSPTGDVHDYVSYARYWWPNPNTPDGLPYVQHDGQHNEAQVAKGDHARLGDFCSSVVTLAAAWQVDHDEAAARRAGEWLRAWFINPATRMNPNLEYAQVRLGRDHNHGSKSGVIDARAFGEVVDALVILHHSPGLTSEDEATIRRWFDEYLEWLLTSKNGKAERAAKNNHGSWYLAQAIPIARYVGRDDLARSLCESDQALLAHQIKPDGSQPEELRRVDALGYSAFNLEAQVHVARLAAGLGIDLWHYAAPDGGSLRKAIEYLWPYNAAPKSWPHSQHASLQPGFLDGVLRGAGD
jgi:hypothetical protein